MKKKYLKIIFFVSIVLLPVIFLSSLLIGQVEQVPSCDDKSLTNRLEEYMHYQQNNYKPLIMLVSVSDSTFTHQEKICTHKFTVEKVLMGQNDTLPMQFEVHEYIAKEYFERGQTKTILPHSAGNPNCKPDDQQYILFLKSQSLPFVRTNELSCKETHIYPASHESQITEYFLS